MVFFGYGFAVLIFLLFPSFPCLSNTDPSSFSFISIGKSSFNIDQINPDDYITLSECYAARGEDYLILDEDQNALKDFILSYEYALRCSEQNNDLLFRPLLGAFLVYIRLENIEAATEIHAELQSILSSFCFPCQEALGACKSRNFKEFFTCASYQNKDQPDWPIIGPDRIPIDDCLDRVRTTVKALKILTSSVKNSAVRNLANILIDELADTGKRCCKAGGIWKGCLQQLVNKLHYWKVLGIPADPAWD